MYHFYVHTASQHLQAERIKIDTQLRLLQEERDLVDKHLAEQQRKQAELSSTEIGLRERAGMVRGTLQSLQVSTEYILCLCIYNECEVIIVYIYAYMYVGGDGEAEVASRRRSTA